VPSEKQKRERSKEMCPLEKKTTYFGTAGVQNTKALLSIVKDYVDKEGIETIIVATNTGETGVKIAKAFRGKNAVVVTHCYGFQQPGKFELKDELKEEILTSGAKILTATHALSSAERAIRKKFGTLEPLEIIANTLRLMGEGTKVCVEITLMAADAGLISCDNDVVAVAGTGKGADTALRIKPANAARLFDLRIREVIAKPSDF
jgi:hypothetical protein